MGKIDYLKIIDRAAIIIANLAIIIAMGVGPALLLASSEDYYQRQFEKNEIYSYVNEDGNTVLRPVYYINGDPELCGYLTDSQLDTVVKHIIDFLFGDTESFELYMDDVIINGETADNVSIFGEAAVTHMHDVKGVMHLGIVLSIVSVILLPFLVAYITLRRKECAPLLIKYTAIFWGTLGALLLGLCIVSLAIGGDFLSSFWTVAHYLFFPFQPDKVAGSFFNDTLTMILTIDLFMDAVVIVLSSLIAALTAWFVGIFFIRKRTP